ncbi:thiamine-phosphate kinase [Hahella sp. CCB-MM4]|uniref:thiamine-phosphate kinase n=1 Tax=Hahella sp. (strain CCB-MM4) TaxID=1926491 RepID=UPI000B9A79DA|nr:thiamine-phosphate kinase [Hahella sp. CCB-MM4]OZG71455.1 thiamine-phosphate kinase [Hahella sp. CCB-MM4]
MDEFSLINQFFRRSPDAWKSISAGIAKGIGDDCAVLGVTDQQVVVSTDTMIAGRHFPDDCPGDVVASRALAAAASDLAAMGAGPLGFTLSLSMPRLDLHWCQTFADTLHEKAIRWQIPLIGGDTVKGPLNISITVLGLVPPGQALMRNGAKPGEDIWVSGWLGNAAGGLEVALAGDKRLTTAKKMLLSCYQAPVPRFDLGRRLLGVASSAIDISDGLLADWQHIADVSDVGAEIFSSQVPISKELTEVCGGHKALNYALAGGDDYELCFTAPQDLRSIILELSSDKMPLTRIGRVKSGQELSVIDGAGKRQDFQKTGFNHFG